MKLSVSIRCFIVGVYVDFTDNWPSSYVCIKAITIMLASGCTQTLETNGSTKASVSQSCSVVARRQRSKELAQKRRTTYKSIMDKLTEVWFVCKKHVWFSRVIFIGCSCNWYFLQFMFIWVQEIRLNNIIGLALCGALNFISIALLGIQWAYHRCVLPWPHLIQSHTYSWPQLCMCRHPWTYHVILVQQTHSTYCLPLHLHQTVLTLCFVSS